MRILGSVESQMELLSRLIRFPEYFSRQVQLSLTNGTSRGEARLHNSNEPLKNSRDVGSTRDKKARMKGRSVRIILIRGSVASRSPVSASGVRGGTSRRSCLR